MGLLKINGKDETFPDNKMPATIADLLRHLGVDSTTVVAELEGVETTQRRQDGQSEAELQQVRRQIER